MLSNKASLTNQLTQGPLSLLAEAGTMGKLACQPGFYRPEHQSSWWYGKHFNLLSLPLYPHALIKLKYVCFCLKVKFLSLLPNFYQMLCVLWTFFFDDFTLYNIIPSIVVIKTNEKQNLPPPQIRLLQGTWIDCFIFLLVACLPRQVILHPLPTKP